MLGKYNIREDRQNARVEGGRTMFLAEGAEQTESLFQFFDIFMIVFTLILIWAVFRQIKQRPRNKFAIGFAVVSLIVFLIADVKMISGW
ncbi:hypothetical protein ACE3MS_16010 [Paenibacillus dendritiformis]|uniref:DUF2759 family protein n=1 Tax=Paenibacillus dendritiformis C454 TaxID=1131935 RepID=H3S9N3_9BACL|nr:hypothetical protein PDENDC454_01060 [Paenibacillus dendritiformis C454]